MKKVIQFGLVVLLVLIVIFVISRILALKKMFGSFTGELITDNYYETTERFGKIESKYGALGPFEVSYIEFDSDNVCKKYEIWYPSELRSDEKYPLIVVTNGSNCPASQYVPFFKHLASWGFVVIGNEDENTRTGASSSLALDFMLTQNTDQSSIFYSRIDLENIGIAGHSQGGVGAINAVTKQNGGSYFKTIFTASATSRFYAHEERLGADWVYDVSKLNIPYFMCAGTGATDAGTAENAETEKGQGICPLWSLKEHLAALPDGVAGVMARRTNKDHTDMLVEPDAYMTAWFMFWLRDDEDAGRAFFGEDAELPQNQFWQDVEISGS